MKFASSKQLIARSWCCERLDIETDLPHAISRGEMSVHYQPIVDINSGRIVQLEALARWAHPTLGPIAPSLFIPIAEDIGLIHVLGQWVLEQACRQLKIWRAKHPHQSALAISLNISLSQLLRADFASIVRHSLGRAGLPAGALTLEITEDRMTANIDEALCRFEGLRDAGARLAIDDFGKGYSSLHCLAQIPVDILKIDREFISRMSTSVKDEAVIRSIIKLAHSLDLKVIGEGVETIEQLGSLRSYRCDYAQGYLFSVPGSADRIDPLLAEPVCKARFAGIAWHVTEGA